MDARAVQCSVMLAFMGRMLDQGMRLKARCLALAYANVHPYVFSFMLFVRSAFWGKEIGGVLVFPLCRAVCLAR